MWTAKMQRTAYRQLVRKKRIRELANALALGFVCAALVAGGILLAHLTQR